MAIRGYLRLLIAFQDFLNTFHDLTFTNQPPSKDIGYAIAPSYRQMGYATEAALALKDSLITLGFKEMTGFCLPTNEPSNAILRKLGFERAGEALVNGKIIANAYVLPGMKHFTVENTRFSRMGVDK
jgi:RimJ/RimL family protein N-acetyltransferase